MSEIHAYPWLRIDWPTERLHCARCRTWVALRTDHVEGVVAAGAVFIRIHASCTLPELCPVCEQEARCTPECSNPLGRDQITHEQLELVTEGGS